MDLRGPIFNLMHNTDHIESIVKKDRIIVMSSAVAVAAIAGPDAPLSIRSQGCNPISR